MKEAPKLKGIPGDHEMYGFSASQAPLGINSRLKNVISALRRSACLSSRSLFGTLSAKFLHSFSLTMKGLSPDGNE